MPRSLVERSQDDKQLAAGLAVRIAFNPNLTTAWFVSVMAIIDNITVLALILAGAAIVRDRDHGTMDHLLVMRSPGSRSRWPGSSAMEP